MLNRMNRTLSANPNRLNLGTRPLAPIQGGNMGPKSLRIRHAHPFAAVEPVRAGTAPAFRYPSPLGASLPSFPDSPQASARSVRRRAAQSWCEPFAPSQPTRKPVVVTDRPCLVGPSRDRCMTVSGRVGDRARTASVAALQGLAIEG